MVLIRERIMADKTPDYERLLDVSDGKVVLDPEEFMSIIPEVAEEKRVQQLIASYVIAKRLVAK